MIGIYCNIFSSSVFFIRKSLCHHIIAFFVLCLNPYYFFLFKHKYVTDATVTMHRVLLKAYSLYCLFNSVKTVLSSKCRNIISKAAPFVLNYMQK